MRSFVGFACALLALCAVSDARAQTSCKNEASGTASIDFITKTLPPASQPLQTQNNPTPEVELKDEIYLHVNGLADLLAELKCWQQTQPTKQLVLYMNGLPVKDLTGALPRPSDAGFLKFQLVRSSAAKEVWNRIMGRPWPTMRPVAVSIGFADQYPIRSGVVINLVTLPVGWFLLGTAFVIAVGVGIIWLGLCTPLLRDATLPDGTPGTYSLARTQGAWWFFIILAAYILIATVTGEINGLLNGTALTLLGIGAATAAGAAIVNASKSSEQKQAEQHLNTQVQTLQAQGAPAQQVGDLQTLLQRVRDLGKNKDFIHDILSDADGISIHRFQMVIWMVVLGFIFGKEAYETLAMPDFDGNLLALQGISAATYVGLKTTEPAVPKAAKQQ